MQDSVNKIISLFVHNRVFANLLALGMVVAGIVAAFQLPRETFPETAVDYLLITVAYPGASPEDVEQGVCIKIEQAIEGIQAIWEISSLSEENFCNVGAAFDPRITPTSEVLRQVQNRINGITTFPEAAEEPVVIEVLARTSVINIGVHGDAPEASIKRVAEQIRTELIALPDVSQVALAGVRDYEISIRLREETLRQHELTLEQVMQAVASSSLDLPAGTLRTRNEEINVRTTGQRYSVQDFEDLVVLARPDGATIRLGQIANVADAFADTTLFGRVDGEAGATVIVSKTAREDISAVAQAVRDYVARTPMPDGIRLSVLADKSRDVDQRLQMLISNGIQGMILLMICLILFMDFRAAVGVAMGIPVATAGALWVLDVTGSTLNMISLFGLIMADAIVLDDSIVISESIVAGEKAGLAPELAAIRSTREVAMPVLIASLTTVIMFLPLMYVEGVMGKLIYVLPVAVIATIVASGVEAFFILPCHMAEWSAKGSDRVAGWRVRTRKKLNGWIEGAIARIYGPVIRRLARVRYLVLGASVGLVLFCAGLVFGGRTPFVLFPKVDGNTLRARVRFPEGTPADVTHAAVKRIEATAQALNSDPALSPAQDGSLVQHVYSVVGQWPDIIPKRGSGLAEVTIELMPSELRRIDSADIIEHWRKAIGVINGAVAFTITREELGPTEKPLEIRLLGDDLDELRAAADDLEIRLAEFNGVFDIEDDLIPGKRELQVRLKPQAATLGLTLADLAAQLRQGLYGGEAMRVQRGRDELRVLVSFVDADRQSLSDIDNLHIRTRNRQTVPFAEVADTVMTRGYSTISRQDGTRRVRIQADVDERHANAEQIVQSLAAGFLPELDRKYGAVTYRIDGQRARIKQSMDSLVRATIVALVLTYTILGASLRSYLQPLILLAAVPLGMAGAVIGHAVMGYDLSLMSVFGMTALAGIVVNDGLVLLDKLNQNVAAGMKIESAVTAAAESRVLAVFLTALTNVAGLSPMLLERSSQAQPLIPIAISVTFGLTFSTVLVILIIPSLYLVGNDAKRMMRWLRVGGSYPTPEDVERDPRAARGEVNQVLPAPALADPRS